jgi:DNA polymerase-3 subunit alpha (Gram-positive type)
MEIDAATFVVLDTETTGLEHEKGDRIVEFGAIRIQAGRELERMQSLVNPARPIPAEATKTHGITDEMVKSAPPFADLAPKLRPFLAGTVLVGQNVVFDLNFLNTEFQRAGMSRLLVPTIDTIALARRARPGLATYNLDNLAFQFRVTVHARHRSIGDAEATVKIFQECAKILRQKGECRTLEDLIKRGTRGDTAKLPRIEPAAPSSSPSLL